MLLCTLRIDFRIALPFFGIINLQECYIDLLGCIHRQKRAGRPSVMGQANRLKWGRETAVNWTAAELMQFALRSRKDGSPCRFATALK